MEEEGDEEQQEEEERDGEQQEEKGEECGDETTCIGFCSDRNFFKGIPVSNACIRQVQLRWRFLENAKLF